MKFIKSMNIGMARRIQCEYCKKNLAGEGHLKRHLRTVHKLKQNKD